MSRHVVGTVEQKQLVVGWDPPLGTYYGQVFDVGAAAERWDDDLIDACGDTAHEIKSTEALGSWCESHGFVLPEDVIEKIQADRAEKWTPGPLQRALGFTGEAE